MKHGNKPKVKDEWPLRTVNRAEVEAIRKELDTDEAAPFGFSVGECGYCGKMLVDGEKCPCWRPSRKRQARAQAELIIRSKKP